MGEGIMAKQTTVQWRIFVGTDVVENIRGKTIQTINARVRSLQKKHPTEEITVEKTITSVEYTTYQEEKGVKNDEGRSVPALDR
jgi:hypothetical protein